MHEVQRGPLGAVLLGKGRCLFRVWAPSRERVTLKIIPGSDRGAAREVVLCARPLGYHEAVVEDVSPGDRYAFELEEGLVRPDPASRAQPDGVHRPSMVVDPAFQWTDSTWRGTTLEDYVFYELHVGTFTEEGTFTAAIEHLDDLVDLGVTCVEIMPVAQFPGERNWGYDGVYPYAPQWSYGGIDGMRSLVDACHARGLAVCLDVVYNHLGPEGNYLRDFGPYFTRRYGTPWGEAVNFDDRHSDEVRHYFLENVRWWIEDVHIDALRLDAVHAIFDQSAVPFLREVAETVRGLGERLGRRVHVIAESDLHDPRMILPPELGGIGMHSEWNDDLHHSVHSLLTGETNGYYVDFGSVEDLAATMNGSYARGGKWSRHRERRHGASATGIPRERFVVCVQNHDQVGNRLLGERLASLVSFESSKLAAGTMLLSPFLPLLFMGEEYGETRPFLYFVDHGDPDLINAVRRGRAEEFTSFGWTAEPPDPASEETFLMSKLDRSRRDGELGARHLALYKELLRLRREHPLLGSGDSADTHASSDPKRNVVCVRRSKGREEVILLLCFASDGASVRVPARPGAWRKMLDSSEPTWKGPGSSVGASIESDGEIDISLSGRSFVLLEKQEI